jgi:hypothetical protein
VRLIRVRIQHRGWPEELAEGATSLEHFKEALRIGGQCLLGPTNSDELRAHFGRCSAMEAMDAHRPRLRDAHQVPQSDYSLLLTTHVNCSTKCPKEIRLRKQDMEKVN